MMLGWLQKVGEAHTVSAESTRRQRETVTDDFWIDLALYVPSVANWSFSTLPKSLLPGQVEQMLDHCRRSDEKSTAPTGAEKQSYAAIVLRAWPRETSKSAEM